MTMRDFEIVRMGSRVFPYSVPQITHATTFWYDLPTMIGNQQEAALWDYLDSLVILNNSALPVHFYLNNTDNDYYILPYGTQPVTRRAFRTIGFYNPDVANDITAGLVTVNMRRLPPDVISVINQS
jgi:hypothetical protein